ncbi:MAG: hypothetical protein IPI16_19375 [Comamonadaceae bacterium]|nr:hypothetical protein [Comamonadaceae bacterium]
MGLFFSAVEYGVWIFFFAFAKKALIWLRTVIWMALVARASSICLSEIPSGWLGPNSRIDWYGRWRRKVRSIFKAVQTEMELGTSQPWLNKTIRCARGDVTSKEESKAIEAHSTEKPQVDWMKED